MRIGLVIYDSLDIVSGGYLYDRMLVEYLRRHGEQVEIIAIPRRSYAFQLADNLSPRLCFRLAQAQVDLMLQDELNHPSLFWLNQRLNQLKQERGGPKNISIVHHLHSSEDHPGWQMKLYRWVERRYLHTIDGFIYNSQTTQQAVETLAGSPYPAIVAPPAGDLFQPAISPDDIQARAQQKGPLKLIFVGNIIPRKGLHTLLAALAEIPEDTAALTIVGKPTVNRRYTNSILEQLKESNLEKHVRFLGQLSQAHLAAEIRSHHLMVMPSSYEGFGIVYLEGMGFGLPAVGTTSGGAREIITHGQDGYLITSGDQTMLGRLLLDLHNDRHKLALMSVNARQRYLAHPTWEETCAAIHEFMRRQSGITT